MGRWTDGWIEGLSRLKIKEIYEKLACRQQGFLDLLIKIESF